MLHLNQKVSIPKGCKIKKQNHNKYVYHVTKIIYHSDKKYSTDERVCIGKICSDNSNVMFPNDNFFVFFPDSNVLLSENTNLYSDTISIGNGLALYHIVTSFGLDNILQNVFEEKADLIIALSFYFIDEKSSVIQLFNRWAFNNLHFLDHIPSQSTISNLFNHYIKPSMCEDFLLSWTKHILLRFDNEPILLALDSTNMNVSSNNIALAEHGIPKIDEGLAQINLAYALEQTTGLPIYYDLYPGSIPDVSQCKLMVQKARDYQFNDLCFVMDAGYFSEDNIKFFNKEEYNFIMMAKSNLAVYKKMQNDYETTIKNKAEYYLLDYDVYGIKIEDKIFRDVNRKYYIYFYYNPDKANHEINNYNNIIRKFLRDLKDIEVLTEQIKTTYQKYLDFIVDSKGKVKEIKVNLEKQQEVMSNAGYFMIVSTLDKSLGEVLKLYKRRDIIEKTFRMLKSSLDADKYYATNDQGLMGKVFVNFISSIIRAQVGYKCKGYLKDYSSETVNSILGELSKIQISKTNEIYRRKYALTSKQKEILKHLEIDENYIDNFIVKFNKKLFSSIKH